MSKWGGNGVQTAWVFFTVLSRAALKCYPQAKKQSEFSDFMFCLYKDETEPPVALKKGYCSSPNYVCKGLGSSNREKNPLSVLKKKVTPLQGHSFGGCAQKWHGTRMDTYHKFPSIGLCRGYAACLQVNPERSWKLDSVSCTEPPPLHSFIPPDQHRLKHLKGIYHWINTSLVQQDYQGVLCAFLMCH